MVMYENEFKTKEKEIWTKDKIEPQRVPQHHISDGFLPLFVAGIWIVAEVNEKRQGLEPTDKDGS